MTRNASLARKLVVATGLALASFAASADDSSMSVLTGDSYAYFNGLEFRLGEFNRPATRSANAGETAERTAAQRRAGPRILLAGPMPDRMTLPRDAATGMQDTVAAPRDATKAKPRVFVPSPFRDDTGA